MKFKITLTVLLFSTALTAQESASGRLDEQFKPTTKSPTYTSHMTQTDSGWVRQSYFYLGGQLAAAELFEDENATIPISQSYKYYRNGQLRAVANHVAGKKSGVWLTYHENGKLADSAFYENDLPIGVSVKYDKRGNRSDSITILPDRSRIHTRWYSDGQLLVQQYFQQDTIPVGTWNYFYETGKPLAIVSYENGKEVNMQCFDANGKIKNNSNCLTQPISTTGKESQWIKLLMKHLNPSVPLDNNSPFGFYTVMVEVVFNKDGTLGEPKPLTNWGYGMEEEVLRILKLSPKWQPETILGNPVSSIKVLTVSFSVGELD